MATPSLKREHHAGKFGMVSLPSVAAMVDLPILAENTEQITVREKNRSRSTPADKLGFFAKMGSMGSDFEGVGGIANSLSAQQAIGAALARTKAATFEKHPECPFTAFKFPATFQFKISGCRHISALAPFFAKNIFSRENTTRKAKTLQRCNSGNCKATLNKLSSG
jgi:hypothetical protein